MSFSVIIPAYNLEKLIGETVSSCHSIPAVKEILVIDDGSRDKTGEKASKAGARVIKHPLNRGKGAALISGIKHCTCDRAVFLDGDLGNLQDLDRLLQPVQEGRYDMAIGVLPPQKKEGLGFVKRTARRMLRRATGLDLNAPLSGQRALSARALDLIKEELTELPSHFGIEIALTLIIARRGLGVGEVPVNFLHLQSTGLDPAGFLHRGKQGWDIFRTFYRLRKI